MLNDVTIRGMYVNIICLTVNTHTLTLNGYMNKKRRIKCSCCPVIGNEGGLLLTSTKNSSNGIMMDKGLPKCNLVSRYISWICLRCLEQDKQNNLPNGGLMVTYHGTIRKKSPKNKSKLLPSLKLT